MRTHIAAALAAVCTPFVALAQSYSTAVPAFFALTLKTDGSNYDWDRLNRTSVPIIAVAGLDSIGTGTGGSGCTRSPTAMFDCLRTPAPGRAAHKLLGYVTTNGGTRPVDQVMGTATPPDGSPTVNRWYTNYNGHIDGIFLDVGPAVGSGTATQSYYQTLYNRISAFSGSCGSGRACVMINVSQFEQSWVQQVSDYNVLWEHPLDDGRGQNYLTNFIPASTQQSPQGWYFTPGTAARSSHTVYNTQWANLGQVVCKSWSYGSPMLYVYDGTSSAYDHLPPYYENMIDNLQGCPVNPPCGATITDACGNACSLGTYCAPGAGMCQDCGGYDCCR